MSPVTHFLTGWVLATAAGLERRERALVTVAAVIPDIDGLGIVPELLTRHSHHPLLWFSQYHHVLHTLLFAIVISVSAAVVAKHKLTAALMAFVAFHLHLLEDLAGSRGPDGFNWPIPYLHPFTSRWDWTWQGQWQLNAWPNIALTTGLLCVTVWFATVRGYSPVDIFSQQADKPVVSVLQRRTRLVRG